MFGCTNATCRDIFLTSPQTGLGQVVGWQFPNSRMSEYFGPLMRSSRAREQRANERFLPLSRERSFRWFHEALVFETSLRPLPPLMFVGFSHRFLPFASNAGISKAYREPPTSFYHLQGIIPRRPEALPF